MRAQLINLVGHTVEIKAVFVAKMFRVLSSNVTKVYSKMSKSLKLFCSKI